MDSPQLGYSSHFGFNNIPFGIASSTSQSSPTCVTRFEDHVIFLSQLNFGIQGLPQHVFQQTSLNEFAALPRSVQQDVRREIQNQISNGIPETARAHVSTVSMHLPVQVGDFTDFSCSLDHVQNASEAMTGIRSSPPAFFHMPIGYAGRCSSLDVSGTPVERPMGQYWSGKPGQSDVVFGPCKKMDYELELGCIIGKPIPRKERVTASRAEEHIFGYVLVNDWSARDIQALEMNPLGPLNGKNAGTTISPWIITTDAVSFFMTTSPSRKHQVAPYLEDSGKEALNINLEVKISRNSQADGSVACRSNSSWMYWTLPQCVAHQVIGGCGLRTGDLLASGTVSGGGDHEHGCLMEFMKAGHTPPRGYLEDGETVTLSGFCGDGVGFGECVATLTAARVI
jgi:fumarylacetoacetase